MTDNNSLTPSHQEKSWEREDEHLAIKKQVAHDISQKLSEYADPKKGIRLLSHQMGIHEKTLKRLLNLENKPHYQSLLKIYRVLLQAKSDSEILDKVPDNIKEFLKRSHPKGLRDDINYSLDVEKEVCRNPIFCEIYFLAGTGGISKEYIGFHYGQYGERIFEQMLEQKVLIPFDKAQFVLGPNQANFSPDSLKKISIHLAERFSKPSMSDVRGSNYQSLFAYSLNPDAYNEWLKIDEEAYKKKVDLARKKESRGNLKVFTYQCTDTLMEKADNLKH